MSSPSSQAGGGASSGGYGSISRIGNMFKPSGKFGTFSSRNSRSTSRTTNNSAQHHEMYASDELNDSAEDIRTEIERQQREAETIENVRECCDGMFLQV